LKLFDVLVEPLVLVANEERIVDKNANFNFTIQQAGDAAFVVARQSELSAKGNTVAIAALKTLNAVADAGVIALHCVNKVLAVSDITEAITRANNNVVVRQTLLILATGVARQENSTALEVDVTKVEVTRLDLGVPQRHAENIAAPRVARNKVCLEPIRIVSNTHYNDRVAVVKDNSSKQMLRRIVNVSVREGHVSSSTSC
jgi:hypothetical protein